MRSGSWAVFLGGRKPVKRWASWFLGGLRELTYAPAVCPRVYFVEWAEPMIAGIPWISEIIQMVGGDDIFAGRTSKKAEQRVVSGDEIVAANPQIILASWGGKPVDIDSIRSREGFSSTDAVQTGQIHELPPEMILQAGPALVSGLEAIRGIVQAWEASRKL